MTPDQRYQEIREQSDVFANKNMLKHHFIRHLKEAMAQAYQESAAICRSTCAWSAEYEILERVKEILK